jgi:hypothetical protein
LIKFNRKWIHIQDDCQCQISELIQGQATKRQEGLSMHSEKSKLLEISKLKIKGFESKINWLIKIVENPQVVFKESDTNMG